MTLLQVQNEGDQSEWGKVDRKKNKGNVFFGEPRNNHPVRLQDFWDLKGSQSPAREAQVNR